ncbi:RNA 2',3'-cyclic phosphodiesterase [Virgibacillus siamensis]|uniref:RNA 2',3'-cyclic phosphodiesterase n=1 Tax=Virgibacillus siamensis TaxID=480071 RepID=UPI0009867726|nr:RNA 2',3'-cyclic phosphodiesterase [Virgibacillus siamensis]
MSASLPHYFIAVPLPKELKMYLAEKQEQLRDQLPYKQWPHMDDLHITLKFLGPVSDDQLDTLINNLECVTGFPSFHLRTGSVGTFGNPKQPRVLWTGVEKTEPLLELQQLVEWRANESGFQPEKRNYSPHITLAKKWNNRNEMWSDLSSPFMTPYKMLVNRIVLYQIFPDATPKYKQVAEYQLKTDDGII